LAEERILSGELVFSSDSSKLPVYLAALSESSGSKWMSFADKSS